MKRYKYKVKDSEGKIIESYFDAENQTDVQSFLLNKGYEIISITEDKFSNSIGLVSMSSGTKMNSKELNFFLTQLSTYVKAGIPLVDSMEILSRQAKSKSTQMLYRKIVFELNKGTTFKIKDSDKIEAFLRKFSLSINHSFIFSTTLFISYGISGINATSAPPAIADSNAIHPAYLPITSRTITLWCDSAVVCNLSIASVATETAVL